MKKILEQLISKILGLLDIAEDVVDHTTNVLDNTLDNANQLLKDSADKIKKTLKD